MGARREKFEGPGVPSPVDRRRVERAFGLAALSQVQMHLARNRTPEFQFWVALDDATLVPPEPSLVDLSSERFQGGVVDADGSFEPLAHHYSSITPWVASDGTWAGTAEESAGTVLYGGVAREHFGHFIAESLGRIWWFYSNHGRSEVEGLAFVHSPIGPASTHGLDLLGLFASLPPVSVVAQPTRFAEVVVPLQASSSELGMLCIADVAYTLRRQLAPEIVAGGDRSIYVSRSRWLPGPRRFSGGILDEWMIEERLADAGYEIYHPQDDSVVHQVETYRSAGRIICNEGSALHLIALAAPETSRVAVIGRRQGLGPVLEAFLEVYLGPAAAPRFVESGAVFDINSWGERWVALDYPRLAVELIQRGMLGDEIVWGQHDADLDQLNERAAALGPDVEVREVR